MLENCHMHEMSNRGRCVVSAADPQGRIPVYRPETLLFLPRSSSIVFKRLNGPHSRPTTSQKMW
jgi:hypothetical protein